MPFEHGWLAQRFICIGAAITDLQPGKMVIVVDDVDCNLGEVNCFGRAFNGGNHDPFGRCFADAGAQAKFVVGAKFL